MNEIELKKQAELTEYSGKTDFEIINKKIKKVEDIIYEKSGYTIEKVFRDSGEIKYVAVGRTKSDCSEAIKNLELSLEARLDEKMIIMLFASLKCKYSSQNRSENDERFFVENAVLEIRDFPKDIVVEVLTNYVKKYDAKRNGWMPSIVEIIEPMRIETDSRRSFLKCLKSISKPELLLEKSNTKEMEDRFFYDVGDALERSKVNGVADLEKFNEIMKEKGAK